MGHMWERPLLSAGSADRGPPFKALYGLPIKRLETFWNVFFGVEKSIAKNSSKRKLCSATLLAFIVPVSELQT